MLKSMTGFGRGEAVVDGKRITVEIKSVNHRYSEVAVRIPRAYSGLEERIRRRVLADAARGRFDVFINVTHEGENSVLVKVDKELAIAYHKSLREIGELLQISPQITAEQLSRLPGIFTLQEPEEDLDEFWGGLEAAVAAAMAELTGMREAEGLRLEADILQRIKKIEKFSQVIMDQEPRVVEAHRERLDTRIKELVGEGLVDESRLAVEAAIFAERCNITEELVRLVSHLQQMHRLLMLAEPSGRKLDFLLQELNREANTIGSKANDAEISHTVVEIKSELEKIREQIQNIE